MFDMRRVQEQVIYEAVKEQSDAETAQRVVYGRDGETDPEWVNAAMARLDSAFDADMVKCIRMNCQCGYGIEEKIALVKELKDSASNLEEFAGSQKAHEAGLYYEDGQLYLQFAFCPCPMLEKVSRLETKTWCHCSAGYSKALFEKAFGCETEVEMLKSIKTGDDVCLMKITMSNPVF